MYDLITVGDIKMDTFVLLHDASLQCQLKMPECQLCIEYGAKIDVRVVDAQIAGSAPNVAVALSRMGKKTSVVSVMGQDGTRSLALEVLKKEKVSSRYIQVVKDQKSSYSVVLNYKGEKTILTSHITKNYRLPDNMPKTKWLYVCEMGEGYEMIYKTLAHKHENQEFRIAMNPGSVQLKGKRQELFDLIKNTEILFINADEARDLTGTTTSEIHHLATKTFELGAKMVVITDGKNGAHSFDGNQLFYAPIFPGKLVEATGAGDAFASGFLGAIMHGLTPKEGLAWGSVNASSVVGYVGPQPGLLSATVIADRLKKHPAYHIKVIS